MKKKLKLEIEALRVEQFETHPVSPTARGTVHGLESESHGIGASAPCRYCVPMPDTYSCEPYICG